MRPIPDHLDASTKSYEKGLDSLFKEFLVFKVHLLQGAPMTVNSWFGRARTSLIIVTKEFWGCKQTSGNDICVTTRLNRDDSTMSPWREVPTMYWQAIAAHNLVVL